MQLTLIGRAYCHLCEDMQVAIQRLGVARGIAFSVHTVDLDEHPHLEDRYGALIPVLLGGDGLDGVEICHHLLDEAALVARNASAPAS